MKTTIKLMLITRKTNKLGHHPIHLKITIARKTNYISSGKFIDPKYWDEKNECIKPGHPMASTWNGELSKLKQDASRNVLMSSLDNIKKSPAQIKAQVLLKDEKPGVNIFKFVDDFIVETATKRQGGTLENYRKHTLRLELYHGSRDLTFQEIDEQYLTGFEQHLAKDTSENYRFAIMKTLRTFFNAAKKKQLIDNYPFSVYEMPKYLSPGKQYLTLEEVKRIADYARDQKPSGHRQAAIYFVLGCYTGLRLSDWYDFDVKKNIHNEMLKIRTVKNKEFVTVPVSSLLKAHLPLLQQERLTLNEKPLNRYLKDIAGKVGIYKRISTHVARHTFAITMCAERGISAETCSQLMGIKLVTCVENYYKVTAEKIKKETLMAWESL